MIAYLEIKVNDLNQKMAKISKKTKKHTPRHNIGAKQKSKVISLVFLLFCFLVLFFRPSDPPIRRKTRPYAFLFYCFIDLKNRPTRRPFNFYLISITYY